MNFSPPFSYSYSFKNFGATYVITTLKLVQTSSAMITLITFCGENSDNYLEVKIFDGEALRMSEVQLKVW